ncbi:MAG TPA: hypothetical protein VLI39_00695 [Sedimentisphaerales bacterium]|nr:hypothetical protein [Sedimentisphaerales bacterium]
MKDCCGNPHGRKTEARDEPISPLQGFTLSPPPSETGPEPLYRVVYTIDINAMNARHAAQRACEIMKDPQSMPPVLDVIDFRGRLTRIDLSEP